ncbi:MAG: hypothetical protein CBC13_08915 [Planctomycetia bacterium TMED53]|nr:MAG: hypothetical protein CBC13_08915 [Planctomycetia bacterium TMED53]
MMESDSLNNELNQALENFDADRCVQILQQQSKNAVYMEDFLHVIVTYLEIGLPRESLDKIYELEDLGNSVPGYERDLDRVLQHNKTMALYLTGDPQGALRLMRSLKPIDAASSSDREFFIGLCHDHLGDPETANEHFARATELDPEGNPPIPDISIDEAHDLIAKVLSELPEKIRKELEEVPIILEDLPDLSLIQESSGQISPNTLGLYSGSTIANKHDSSFSPHEGMPTAAVIRIYRRNLERMSQNEDDLVEQVKITLLHEIGHHLGLDEDDVDRLGLA